MRRIILGLLLIVTTLVHGSALAQNENGLVSVQSAYSVDETVSRLQTALQERGLTVVTTVNHAGNAQTVGEELRPTQLIIFGNPNLGTPLMQSSQTTAIDLPQKFLVWEAADGTVTVTYNNPQYLVSRHDITGQDETINQVTTALGNFANSVAPTTDAPAEPAPPEPTAVPAPATLPNTGERTTLLAWGFIGSLILLVVGAMLAWRTRRHAKLLLFLLVPAFVLPLFAVNVVAQEGNVLVSVDSPYSVEETITRLQNALDENGLTTVATINHAANAQNAGLELRPTQLIIFGNPAVGTPLMQSNQTIGIDLPQKFLVWEDTDGQVRVTYNDPQYLADRHGITDRAEVIGRVATALQNLSGAATAE